MRRLVTVFAVALCLVLSAGAAFAQAPAAQGPDFAALVKDLGGKSFSARLSAVRALGETGDARAVPVLEAMLGRNLYATKDGRVVVGEKKGEVLALRDAATGADAGSAPAGELSAVRTNNRLRNEINSALGTLVLMSDDPDRRRRAAREVFRSRPKDAIPALERAMARETHAGVKQTMALALAATRLEHGADRAERLDAVRMLEDSADDETTALLRGLVSRRADGGFNEADEVVRTAAQKALTVIESRRQMWDFAGKLFQGVSLGSVLLLAAIGLAITFGVMGVINMAHGEMVMLGAYTTFVIQEIFRAYAPAAFDASIVVAIPAAFCVAGAFGIAIERGIIRFLYGRPLETLLATWGLSLILQQLVRTVFGPTNREVGNPSWMTGAIELPGGVLLTHNRIWIILFSLAVLGMLALVLKRTQFGLQMRAVTQNRRMAGAMGIPTGRVDAMTFGLGSGIAGVGGVALSQIDNVSPNLGQTYIVDSFMVVVFGGVGNLLGTLVGATTLGVVNKFLESWSGAVMAKILVLIAVILFIQKRPTGLFALRGRAVEQ
jgi:urea transport system permease protein